jgi:hypothetical protein
MKEMKLKKQLTVLTIILMAAVLVMSSCTKESGESREVKADSPKMSIHEAVFMGNSDEIAKHIAVKSDLNKKDEYGSSPLAVATTFGKTEAAKLLIEGGADLNAQSADGSTPLHTAAFFGREEIAGMLLTHGADISVRNNYGATALESIEVPFADVKPVYDQLSRDLGPFGLKLDYEKIQAARPVIAEMIRTSSNQAGS